MRPYSHIQCIAFDIDTGHSMEGDMPSYTGYSDDKTDLDKRVRLMRDAISSASGIDQRPTTLKIFMAPEFFFRGTQGYYPIELVSEIMPMLRDKVSRPGYQHWLFIFGTAVGGLKPKPGNHELINIALIQPGGDPNNTGRIVYKENL